MVATNQLQANYILTAFAILATTSNSALTTGSDHSYQAKQNWQ